MVNSEYCGVWPTCKYDIQDIGSAIVLLLVTYQFVYTLMCVNAQYTEIMRLYWLSFTGYITKEISGTPFTKWINLNSSMDK